MPNIEVNCTVSNCVFHKKDNLCGATEILVDTNDYGKTNTEFASDFDAQTNKKEASHSVQTCCKTFKPKEKLSNKNR